MHVEFARGPGRGRGGGRFGGSFGGGGGGGSRYGSSTSRNGLSYAEKYVSLLLFPFQSFHSVPLHLAVAALTGASSSVWFPTRTKNFTTPNVGHHDDSCIHHNHLSGHKSLCALMRRTQSETVPYRWRGTQRRRISWLAFSISLPRSCMLL